MLLFCVLDLASIYLVESLSFTYGHRSQKTEDPVRSPVLKLRTGRLVLRWVTTWEYRLLYVLLFVLPIFRKQTRNSAASFNPEADIFVG